MRIYTSFARRVGMQAAIAALLLAAVLPPPSSAQEVTATLDRHTVQAGDTLYSIARRYGTSVETVAALNRIPHPWHVRLGQTLLFCLP